MTNKKLEGFEKREFKHGVVYLGDAHEILPLLGANVAEVCVTSPPYNLNKRYTESKGLREQTENEEKDNKSLSNTYSKKFKQWYGDFDEKVERVKGDMSGYKNAKEQDYRLDQIEMIAKLLESCKSSVFYNHKIRMAWHSRTKPINKPPSRMQHPWDWVRYFHVWCEITWDRRGIGNPVKNRYHSQKELVYQIERPNKFYQMKGEEAYSDIWRISPSKNVGHVCTFPEKLVENCILPTTDIGDTIIDPYLGSGTTAIVAVKQGRKFIGIEKNSDYFETACKNIQKTEDERDKMEKEGTFNPADLQHVLAADSVVEFFRKIGEEIKNTEEENDKS